MSITYQNNEIKLFSSDQKFNVDVVYARPEDIIKLDFTLDNVKVTFVNGDVDIIFPNGSVISLASYGTLAFDSNAPKMYDADGNLITLEALLQKVQVLNPEDSILILANRDKKQLVQNQEQIDRIIMAGDQTVTDEISGAIVTGVGDNNIKTIGVISNIVDITGNSYVFNLNKGIGDYLSNNYTTFLRGTTDTDNLLPGNTIKENTPKLSYNFLFGDIGVRGANKTINGQDADYYAVMFSVGENSKIDSQLHPIEIDDLGGDYQNKIFNAHSVNGLIQRVLKLDYTGGIAPQSIMISGIPKTLHNGQRAFNLVMYSGGTTKLTYDEDKNIYYLNQLDSVGKVKLKFIFLDDIPDQTFVIKYMLTYYDPKTSAEKVLEISQDVGIRTINHKGDLNLNSTVLNKGVSGLIVTPENAGNGNKIFIGGSIKNEFHSVSGDSLVFTGKGNDRITLESGSNLIYGSTGYNIITGSGTKDNWLVFSGEKKYNEYVLQSQKEPGSNKYFMQSDVINDGYYETLSKGVSLQFYLGVPEENVLALWDQIGYTGDPGNLKDFATSNFVRAFSSITVIGNKNDSISIKNIVGTLQLDTFNLYFHKVVQKVNIYSGEVDSQGNKKILTNQIILHTIKDNDVLVNFGDSDTSTISSKNGSAYNIQTYYFNKFTVKGNANFAVNLNYNDSNANPEKIYRPDAHFVAGEGDISTVNFSGIRNKNGNFHIEFQADIRYSYVDYYGIKGKIKDYFQGFNNIIGSRGNDIFYGNSNSKKYTFDGNSGENILSYEKSISGVTFDATELKIYKINSKNIQDYNKYKATADMFMNIQVIKLGASDNVFLGSHNQNIGNNFKLYLGASNNTLRYDYDQNITDITVFSDDIKVKKDKSSDVSVDIFEKSNEYGFIEFIGSKGSNVFHGGFKYFNIFNGGTGKNNILSYEMYSTNTSSITFDLFKSIVFKSGKTDSYINIQKIIGGKGNDSFTLGNIDPTNSSHLTKIHTLSMIDGGDGDNTLRFNGVNISNLNQTGFAFEYNVENGAIKFYDKNNEIIPLKIKIKNINTIYGTLANNRFIASKDQDFSFDGVSIKIKYDPNNPECLPNTLDYSNFTNDLIIDLNKEIVIKSAKNDEHLRQDKFKNIQSFIGGKGNDTFLSNYSLEKKLMVFDGNEGDNTLEFQLTSISMLFDFSTGGITFPESNIDIKQYFLNITKFIGGGGKNIFKLYDKFPPFLREKNEKGVNINIDTNQNTGRIIIDFDLWDSYIGTEDNPFKISAAAGSKGNGKEGKDAVTYNWAKSNGFIGSKKGNYFTFVDNQDGADIYGSSFELDGNKEAKESVLDYSHLNAEDLNLNLNISDGSIMKITKTQTSKDVLYNFKTIILSKNNDIVKVLDSIKDNLKNLQLVDGNKGNNLLDFSLFTKDLELEITKSGLHVLKIDNLQLSFVNFQKTISSKGNTLFRVTDNSRGARVEILGNSSLGDNKSTTLDLTAVKDIKYWNLNIEDNSKDPDLVGKLIWGEDKNNLAHIISKDITQVKIGEGKNVIYGSLYNHTHYIGSDASGTFNTVDYSMIENRDILTVTIDGNKQSVRFNNYNFNDNFTNFSCFVTGESNDTFRIVSLENISKLTLNGNKGDNSLSFSEFNKAIELDISVLELNIEKTSFSIININNLILTKNNDTIVVKNSKEKNLLFKTIDGFQGVNTFDVRDGSVITFNEKSDNKLSLSNHNEIRIINFYNLKTNTVTGNRFFGSYNASMNFEVVGITKDTDIKNFLTYRNNSGIKIDFNKCEVYKDNNSVDKFSGINYFEGSSVLVNTFYLAKILGNSNNTSSNNAIKTIYINMNPQNPNAENMNKDIIDITKTGDNAVLYVSTQELKDSEVQYKWNDIGLYRFSKNQTIYVSFDENLTYEYMLNQQNSSNNENIHGALVFSNQYGKGGKIYEDGYVVVDTSMGKANTYDKNDKQLAEINFSSINSIKGSGCNKDIFYGSMHNIEYYSSDAVKSGFLYKINPKDGTYGSGTLSYQNFFNEYGIKVIFNTDNTASITENTTNPTNKLDKSYGIRTYVGTTRNDSFVISKNKGSGTIIINGNGGVFNNVDYSCIASEGKGIELDTVKGLSLGDFDYIFKNISVFKLTQNSDIVFGSLDNKGFIPKGSKDLSVDIILDAGGGTDNTIDYSKYLIGSKDNIIKVNADLNLATITKEGKNKDGEIVSSSDTIATLDLDTNMASIKFQKIILSGEYVSNILTVSGRDQDMKTYVEIKNPTEGIIQYLNFEFVNKDLDILWDGQKIDGKNTNIYLTNLNGKHFSFIGFNSINLNKSNSRLTITKNATLVSSGGKLDGGGGKNTLIIDKNDNKSSSIVLRDGIGIIELDLKGGAKCTYQISNFQNFELGSMKNIVFCSDLSYYTITFTNVDAFNEGNFSEISSSYLVLDFQKIANEGVNVVVNKCSLFNNQIIGKDVLINVNNIVLTNNNDTIEIVDSISYSQLSNKKITIDGGRGNNTLSFKKWSKEVDLSKINDKGYIEIDLYILKNFTNIILRDKDDEIILNEQSSLHIDGGGGNNKVTYTGQFMVGNDPGGVIVQEFETLELPGNPSVQGTMVSKSSGKTDNLLRFNYFILPNNCNNNYNALFVDSKANNPRVYTIDFNYTDIAKSLLNTMNYSKLIRESSISVNINIEGINKASIEVSRDKDKDTSIKDRLFNLNNIIGSSKGGDVFNIKGEYNTNLSIYASEEKASTLSLTIANSRLDKNNTIIWNLYGNAHTIQQSSETQGTYLTFRGNITNINVTSTPKSNSKEGDNEFIIKDLSKAYTIIYNVTSERTKDSVYGKINLTYFKSDSEIKIDVTQIKDNDQLQVSKVEISNNSGKTTRIFGVEYIVGSILATNAFHIKNEDLSKSPSNIIYLIGNLNYVGSKDYLTIEGNQYLKQMNMVADEQFGGIRLINEDAKNLDYYVKYIYMYKIQNVSNFTLKIEKSKVYYGTYSFNVDEKTAFNIIFDKETSDLEAILDINGIFFRNPKIGLNIVSNNISNILFEDNNKKSLSISVKNPKKDAEFKFSIFNEIHLEEYQNSHSINIKNNKQTWEIAVNKLIFSGIPDSNIDPHLYLSNILEEGNKNRTININIDFKTSMWKHMNIYADKVLVNHHLYINFVNSSKTKLDITDQALTMLHNIGDGNSKGNLTYHNTNNLRFITLSNLIDHKLEFNLKNINNKLDIKLNYSDLKIDFGVMRSQDNILVLSSNTITFNKVCFQLRGTDQYKIFNYKNLEIVLSNFSSICIDWLITEEYIKGLLQGKNTGSLLIRAANKSEQENTLIAIPWEEGKRRDIQSEGLLKVLLDYNEKGVLTFIFEGINTPSKFIKGNFRIEGIKTSNASYLGFWSSCTEYTITNIVQSLILGDDLDINEVSKISSSIIFKGTNNSKIDIKGGTIDFSLNSNIGNGLINSYSVVTKNILNFDFSNITNCGSFKFHVPSPDLNLIQKGIITVKAPYYSDDKLMIKNIKDISTFPKNIFELDVLMEAVNETFLDIRGRSSVINIRKKDEQAVLGYAKLENITTFIITAQKSIRVHLYSKNSDQSDNKNSDQSDQSTSLDISYIIQVLVHNLPIYYSASLHYHGGNLEYANGAVKKNNKIYDLVSGFYNVNFHEAKQVLLQFTDLKVEYFYNKNIKPDVCDFNIQGDNTTNVFISLENITKKDNNVVIYMENIKSLHFTLDKERTYSVFLVNDTKYCNKHDEMKNFDFKGYFVIFDTISKMKLYFTGNNITQFSKEFDKVTNQNIKVVNSYKDLIDLINNPNLPTDIFIDETKWEVDDIDITINYENTNHSSYIFFEEEEKEEENTEDFDTLYEEMHVQEDQYDSEDSTAFNDINYSSEEESLNILTEEDDIATLYNNFISQDVLEFYSDDIDSIFNSSQEDFLEINNITEDKLDTNNSEVTSNNQEDTNEFLEMIQELNNIENTSNDKHDTLLISEPTIDNDPSSKIEDSMHKQNTINGNYCK